MDRVLVLGRGGAGKSLISLAIADRIDAPAIELDRLFWGDGAEPASTAGWTARQTDLASRDRWVMDGDPGPYDALTPRLARAGTPWG